MPVTNAVGRQSPGGTQMPFTVVIVRAGLLLPLVDLNSGHVALVWKTEKCKTEGVMERN